MITAEQLDKKFDTKFDGLSTKLDEFMVFVAGQFAKLPTRQEMEKAINGAVGSLRSEMHGEFAKVRSDMLSKGEFYQEFNPVKLELGSIRQEVTSISMDLGEVKEIVQRLDRRTDEDVRAVIKDVAKIKTYLSDKGHRI